MDQLRKILGWLKRQHFWVLSVLVALIAIGCWWMAAGKLIQEFNVNQAAINNEFTTQAGVQAKEFLPNETVNEKQIEETKKQAEHVEATWKQLYERQREQVLEWPEQLSPAFRTHVEKLKFGADIPRDLRNNYQNYAARYFPELPEIVGARVMSENEVGAMGEGGGGGRYGGGYRERGGFESGYGSQLLEEEDGDYICQWLDQHVVREALRFPERPAAIRIWVTQEDLWVYKTLLYAIRNTNNAANASRMSNAAIRTIYSLEVGQRAALVSRGRDRIYKVPSVAVADPMLLGAEGGEATGYASGELGGRYSGGPEAGPSAFSMESRDGSYGGQAMTEEQEQSRLLSWRYLDADGKPIAGGGAAAGDPSLGGDPMLADPAAVAGPVDLTVFGTEYKRLPVRMTLQMDQRWLTHLISELANQPLQVEVEEVRINPPGGAGGEGGGGFGRYEGGGAGTSLFQDRAGLQTFTAQPNKVDVIIQGIIYIFNEPNPEVLQTPQGEPQMAMVE